MNSEEGEKIRKLLSLDGKTQCGNGNKNQKANHIVSAVDEDGFCVGEKLVAEKSNEITAIPELLNMLNVKGQVITIDAMGTQQEIAKVIQKKRVDYVLTLKKNHGNMYEDRVLLNCFNDFQGCRSFMRLTWERTKKCLTFIIDALFVSKKFLLKKRFFESKCKLLRLYML